jgi:hypothetical protein
MKKSSIDRVVGKFSDGERQLVLMEKEELFKRQNSIRLELNPLSKTRDQLKIIEEVSEATNTLRRRYGLEDFDVLENNVHVLGAHAWREAKADSLFIPKTQSIFVKETSRNTRFAVNLFRAMVQFKSYGAVQKFTDTGETIEYRRGFIMWSRLRTNDGLKYFQELNDAVVEELAMRYFESQLENPLFRKEIEETRRIKTYAEGLVKQDLSDAYDIRRIPNGFDSASFMHKAERKALRMAIGGSAWKSFFYDTFKKEVIPLDVNNMLDEVFARKIPIFDMFVRPMFTGHLFELSRFIDKTARGKGNLRKIATPD